MTKVTANVPERSGARSHARALLQEDAGGGRDLSHEEGRPLRVICYRNLRRQDWPIAEVKGNNGIGSVLAHGRSIALADVAFVVTEPASQHVIRNRYSEVPAWSVGELVEILPLTELRHRFG
jgi:hypothetical protein